MVAFALEILIAARQPVRKALGRGLHWKLKVILSRVVKEILLLVQSNVAQYLVTQLHLKIMLNYFKVRRIKLVGRP